MTVTCPQVEESPVRGNVTPDVLFYHLELIAGDSIRQQSLGFSDIAHGQLPDGSRGAIAPCLAPARAGVKLGDAFRERLNIRNANLPRGGHIIESLLVRQAPHLYGEFNNGIAAPGNLTRRKNTVSDY